MAMRQTLPLCRSKFLLNACGPVTEPVACLALQLLGGVGVLLQEAYPATNHNSGCILQSEIPYPGSTDINLYHQHLVQARFPHSQSRRRV